MRWYLAFIVVPLFAGMSCKTNPTSFPASKNIEIIPEAVTATEAWFQVRFTDGISAPTTVTRNGRVILSLRNPPADTLIVDDLLLPNQRYIYNVTRSSPLGVDEWNTLDVTTMDTTGHEMVWEIDTLGDQGNSNILRDVAIIDDTTAYAVGVISKKDSLGSWINPPYNLARWNGRTWEPLKVQFWTICGQSGLTSYPSASLYPVGGDSMWIAMDGDQVVRWNGATQTPATCLPVSFSLSRLYASSANSVYGVGSAGHVVRFDGHSWEHIPSGIDVGLIDLSGSASDNMWIVALDKLNWLSSSLVHFDGTFFRSVYSWSPASPDLRRRDSVSGIVTSVYADSRYAIWVTTSVGEYRCPISTRGGGKLGWAPDYLIGFTWAIRGDAPNNVFVAGDYGTILHFNGYSWHHYRELMHLDDNTAPYFRGVAARGNQVFIVGAMNGMAVVYRGRRIN